MASAAKDDALEVARSEVSVSVGKGARLSDSAKNELADFAADACDAVHLAGGHALTNARKASAVRSRVDIRIAGDAEIRRLNRDFRGKDKATDVISFPVAEPRRGAIEGDIAISCAIAAANARRFGHLLTDELKILILHGMLHLAGYDHETDGGEMAALESSIRVALDLPESLTGRASRRGKARRSARVAQPPSAVRRAKERRSTR